MESEAFVRKALMRVMLIIFSIYPTGRLCSCRPAFTKLSAKAVPSSVSKLGFGIQIRWDCETQCQAIKPAQNGPNKSSSLMKVQQQPADVHLAFSRAFHFSHAKACEPKSPIVSGIWRASSGKCCGS